MISFGHSLAAIQLIPLNEWHHLAITYGDSIVKCYLDGILLDSSIITYEIKKTNYPLAIGADPHIVMEYHHGMIDEVRVYNRALSAEEVSAISTVNTNTTQERPNDLKIAVYPNPTEGLLTVESEELPNNWSLKVYDSKGNLVHSLILGSQSETIDLRGLHPGAYVITIETERGRYSKRMIKM